VSPLLKGWRPSAARRRRARSSPSPQPSTAWAGPQRS